MNPCSFKVKGFIFLYLLLIPALSLYADQSILEKADTLLEENKPSEAADFITANIDNALNLQEKSLLYTRLAYIIFRQAKEAEIKGSGKQEQMDLYARSEQYADTAIRMDPSNPMAYFWRGSAAGMWGKLKGVFSALERVEDMRDDFIRCLELDPNNSLAWFSLGQMYRMVPGGIISFGSKDYAVSLARKAVDVMEHQTAAGKLEQMGIEYYVQLALCLEARNWSSRKRIQEHGKKIPQFNNASGIVEKHFYYEGILQLRDYSDREEAKEILLMVVKELELEPKLTEYQQQVYTDTKKALRNL